MENTVFFHSYVSLPNMCLGCLTTNGRLLMEELTMADHTQNQHASIYVEISP
jgi:hypothetical protein